uniref:Uncharacterized protein n=1 Tax=Cucumber mosaic virus TaxID=12305 RepID=A0A3G1S2U4_9BROM|nr:hypothetical protein [Cucumber mosaic virus]AXL94180.1 hypothetical protein [Cucumber mosaic virus]AXL94187.1 hypothetical protein [Cucumber mosaic virus]
MTLPRKWSVFVLNNAKRLLRPVVITGPYPPWMSARVSQRTCMSSELQTELPLKRCLLSLSLMVLKITLKNLVMSSLSLLRRWSNPCVSVNYGALSLINVYLFPALLWPELC